MLPTSLVKTMTDVGIMKTSVLDEKLPDLEATETLKREKFELELRLHKQYEDNVAEILRIKELIKKREEISNKQNELAVAQYNSKIAMLNEQIDAYQRSLAVRDEMHALEIKYKNAEIALEKKYFDKLTKTTDLKLTQPETPGQTYKKCVMTMLDIPLANDAPTLVQTIPEEVPADLLKTTIKKKVKKVKKVNKSPPPPPKATPKKPNTKPTTASATKLPRWRS